MRITIIKCNRCGKEITGNPIKLIPEYVHRMEGTLLKGPMSESYKEQENKDYCEDCMAIILAKANGIAINPDLEKAVIKMTEETKEKKHPGSKKKMDMKVVMKMKAAGCTNSEIADRFSSTPGAVSVACSNYKKKMSEEDKMNLIVSELASGEEVATLSERFSIKRLELERRIKAYKEDVLNGKVKDEEAKIYFEKDMLKGIDLGKVKSLWKAGWSMKKIADELKITENVCKVAVLKAKKM